MKNLGHLAIVVVFTLAASVTASAQTITAQVDIDRADQLSVYNCDVNGYDAQATGGSFGYFINCTLYSTSSSSTPADFGDWHVEVIGTGIFLNLYGCKETFFTSLGVTAHAQYICPKSP